jgi:hypothetical protein
LPGPIIVTALFDPADFAWLDRLRKAHFPPERNLVPAHLTLFHHLPPSLESELHQRLHGEAFTLPPPPAMLAEVMRLDRGVAFRVECAELDMIREELSEAFAGMLTPQDRGGWRPHVTIQNKVAPREAAALHASLSADFRPRPLGIAALASWRYDGGRWLPLARFPFNRSGRFRRN